MNKEVVRQQMLDLIRTRHLAWSTEQSYLGWFDRYCRFLKIRAPAGSSGEKMGAFLSQLAHQGVSASTQNQAFAAILFLYRDVLKQELSKIDSLRARKPVHLRTAPPVEDIQKLLADLEDTNGYPTRLIVRLLYGCGLRLNEGLGLRVKDLMLSESRAIIRDAKGGKDRMVALPCAVIGPLRKQLERVRLVWEKSVEAGVPVKLPGLLARKYPRAGLSWSWFWLFPMHRPCRDPRSGERVQWHCLDVIVQRAVRAAVTKAGLECSVTPHVLRHAYATHALNAGANVRALQAAMGHKSLETTMGYLHADATGVASPLDRMLVMDDPAPSNFAAARVAA